MKIDNLEDIYTLAPLQKGMLFHSLYTPKSGMYFNQALCRLHGNLDSAAFERAWQRVMARHPILRTAFFWEDLDEPLQVEFRQAKLPLEQHDWSGLSSAAQHERLSTLLQEDRRREFELAEAPLMRLTLIRLADKTYQFVWSRHHILLDGWSQALVLKEVFLLYEMLCCGEDIDYGEKTRLERRAPYARYIHWLQKQDLSRAESFWRALLQNFHAPTPLMAGWVTCRLPNHQIDHQEDGIQLSMTTTAGLQALVQQHSLTVNTLVQGLWALLLGRYSGQQDVVFGVTVSGRPPDLADVEAIVGLFINTLPMRVYLSPHDYLLPWLKGLQHQQMELSQYEYSSLIDVHGWSGVPRSQPLFESIVVFENYPKDVFARAHESSLQVSDIRSYIQNSLPLTIRAVPDREFALQVMYDRHRIGARMAGQLLRHFELLLTYIATQPAISLGELGALLDESDRQHQIVQERKSRETSIQKLKRSQRQSYVSLDQS